VLSVIYAVRAVVAPKLALPVVVELVNENVIPEPKVAGAMRDPFVVKRMFTSCVDDDPVSARLMTVII